MWQLLKQWWIGAPRQVAQPVYHLSTIFLVRGLGHHDSDDLIPVRTLEIHLKSDYGLLKVHLCVCNLIDLRDAVDRAVQQIQANVGCRLDAAASDE